jgi:RNA polymerase sigma factor (sigma-70 family)
VSTQKAAPHATVFEGQTLDPLEVLYRRDLARFVGLAQWVVGSRVLAEELVQETFARVVERSPSIDDPSDLGAYVRSALMNVCRSKLRRLTLERRHAKPGPLSMVDVPPDQEVRDALLALPVRQRQCLALRFYEDQTVPEIARTLGITAGSVKTHVHRGLKSLEVAIGDTSMIEEKP